MRIYEVFAFLLIGGDVTLSYAHDKFYVSYYSGSQERLREQFLSFREAIEFISEVQQIDSKQPS